MSRIFDALREAERAREAARLPQAPQDEFAGVAEPPCAHAADEEIETRLKEKEKSLRALERQLDLLATRLTASRADLEVLLAKAQRLERSWNENLEKAQGDSQTSRPGALPSGSAAGQAQLVSELEASSQRLVEQAQIRLEEKTSIAIKGLGKGAEAWLVKLAAELRQTSARQLQEDFLRTLERQRVLMVDRLERETDVLCQQASARIQVKIDQATKEAFESLYKQVGRAVLTTKDWAEHAKSAFEAELQKSLAAFAEKAADISADRLVTQRRESTFLAENLQARLQRAAQILSEDSAAPDAT